MEEWTLTIGAPLYETLCRHLFPGDHDEHGAVIAAGIVTTARGTRLLARDLFIARDGVDFVPGKHGYRMLTPEFVRDRIRYCRDESLVFLAVHNHGGSDEVEFSGDDNASHERGYPALLDISGNPVGALVLARNAVAGDIWTPDRRRRRVKETVVVGRNVQRLYPKPPPPQPRADPMYDRQARWFGDRGQDLLGRVKVGVVGAGGVGLPLVTMLARLGVGELVVIDPERLEPVNLPRMPEARRLDTLMFLRDRAAPLDRLADRLSIRKVNLARRAARRANPNIKWTGIPRDVTEPKTAHSLVDCDYIFLAADSHLARMLVNAIAHQFLIPSVQLGTRIEVDEGTGTVGPIRTNVRPILPGTGCLRCNKLISAARLHDEAIGQAERERNRYVDDVPAPSVITFNTWAASKAATDFMLMFGNLFEPDAPISYLLYRPRLRRVEPVTPVPSKATCWDCGSERRSRRARGGSVELPLPERPY